MFLTLSTVGLATVIECTRKYLRVCFLYLIAFLIFFSVCPYHFPSALPHRHCHPALSSRSCPRAGEGRPAGGPTNSCCWASLTRPGRCRSSSAAIPAGEGPGAGSPPRRSHGETATRETKRPGVTKKGTVVLLLFDDRFDLLDFGKRFRVRVVEE